MTAASWFQLVAIVGLVAAGARLLVVGFAFDGTTRPMASAIVAAGMLSFVAFRLLVQRAAPTIPCR